MLVLKIEDHEVIRIGPDVYLSIGRRPGHGGHRIGIHAPDDFKIDRLRVGNGDIKERMKKALQVDEYERECADMVTDDELRAARATVMPFGKFRGQTLGRIVDENPLYLDWLVDQDIKSDRLRVAVAQVHLASADVIQQRIDERG